MPNRIIRDAILDSDKYDSLPLEARLAFFEILLRADDYGLIPLHNLWLRRHCPVFDGRSSDFADGVISTLADQDLIRVYVAEGKRFAFIPQFGNRPQAIKPKYPVPPLSLTDGAIEEAQKTAKNLPRSLKSLADKNQGLTAIEQGSNRVATGCESPETETETETETEKTKPFVEETGVSFDGTLAVLEKARTGTANCPHDEIVSLYHETLPTLPKVVVWKGKRRDHLQARWREVLQEEKCGKEGGIEFFRAYFSRVGASKFLTGRTENLGSASPFRATLAWLVNPENFIKVIEGRYS